MALKVSKNRISSPSLEILFSQTCLIRIRLASGFFRQFCLIKTITKSRVFSVVGRLFFHIGLEKYRRAKLMSLRDAFASDFTLNFTLNRINRNSDIRF